MNSIVHGIRTGIIMAFMGAYMLWFFWGLLYDSVFGIAFRYLTSWLH